MVGDSEENDDCVIADEMIYIPEVRNEKRPKVGMKFDSLDFVYDFYNRYALLAGFSIRRHSSGREKYSKEILRKEFVCCKQGVFKKEEPRAVKRHRGISRCGCKARVVVVKVSGCKQYAFSLVVEGHNHTMTPPERVHFMRSHRHISEPAKLLTKQLGSADIPTHKKMSILEVQSGGMEKIGFTKKDIYNFEYYESSLMKNHDVELVTEYFLAEQKNNRSFYFKIEGDSNDRLTRCFWADATSRRAYGFYGDVVVLDTTFNTNRYGLPFAPMLGVNNHGQTIVLACAFLSKETTESFIWMFEEFKKAMPGGEPKMIITDQDAAMARAIFEVFPTTFHRLCIWHITTKFSDKLPRTAYEEYWKEFKETIWEIDNIDEFEEKWHAIITKSGLTDHPWLSSVFDLRKSWVPAYVKHIFATGMSSSQRAEGSHAFFKQYISRRNSLMDFITRFQRALSHQRQKELLADHIDAFEKPQCALLLTMDKQMAEIYTKAMFQKFEQELMQSLPCFMELKMDDASKAIYKL
ncbi:protein FAR1-RELATED SEQUENCE 5-like [Prunus dulcis]|uniref:protein FAR1-RELATED SEQUENCE 5-like n=1 Tax=Prunus dulcis TaxID=3755 RepID=UPI0014839095|nr:protein FAR1-RELATED SEQUENCE 5-like [Prunus dulcis]